MSSLKAVLPIAILGGLMTFEFCLAAENKTEPTATIEAQVLRPLLNSERIEQKFGNYHIQVLETNANVRVSDLYSVKDDVPTTRTLAIVEYPENVDPAYAEEHQIIAEGGSIGSTLKQAGWTISKKPLYFGELVAKAKYTKLYERFGLKNQSNVAVHMYEFYISKNGKTFHYASIYELHHPDYLTLEDLNAIYPKEAKAFKKRNAQVEESLKLIEEKIQSLSNTES